MRDSRSVLLLRAPTSQPDRYESALREASYHPISLAVLETALLISNLKGLIKQGPLNAHAAGGVIITSARAAEAWGQAVDELLKDHELDVDGWKQDWSQTPFYTVGPSTAFLLASLSGSPTSPPTTRSRICPRDIRGTDSGNAERLARFILEDLANFASQSLLYLTGDKNRDTLPSVILDEGGGRITLREEQVYATTGVSLDAFERDLVRAAESIQPADPWWIVFFAPSSAAHILPVLHRHFQLPITDHRPPDTGGKRSARIAAIGSTTANFLHDERSLAVAAMPAKPNAEALVEALKAVV